MNELITSLILAILGALVAWITKSLIPYIKSKTTAQQQETALTLISAAVTAAEQIFKSNGTGADKKKYVIAWLKDRGISIDENELDALIEATVYELKNNNSISY